LKNGILFGIYDINLLRGIKSQIATLEFPEKVYKFTAFIKSCPMNLKLILRNSILRQVQHLTAASLREISELLNKFGGHAKSAEATLKLAGAWKVMENELFRNFTINLYENRANDR
jgi:hypothetical protein